MSSNKLHSYSSSSPLSCYLVFSFNSIYKSLASSFNNDGSERDKKRIDTKISDHIDKVVSK